MPVTLNANSSTGFIATSDTSGVLQLQTGGTTAVSIGTDQSFNFSATGQRITGDFSNATVANRVMFQTSTTNSATDVGIAPNGSGASSTIAVYSSSDMNNSSRGSFNSVSGTDIRIASAITGTGTYLPMTFYTGGSERVRIDTSGNVGIGTSSPAVKLDVAGFSKGAIVHRSGSYTNGATTPSVSGATYFVISNSSPTTITNFTNAEDGQIIYLYFGNSNTTIDRTNCYLAGGVNFVSTAADVLVLLKSGSYWFEVSRSLNS